MGADIKTEKGFVDYFIDFNIDPKSTLAKIDKLVDWQPFEKYLAKTLKRKPAAAGQPPYPDLVMFKALILQFLYNMSDDALSYALGDRLSFLNFVGLSFESTKPDASTICRFRQHLLEKNHYRKLLELFNHQLSKHGLLVKSGTAVDATLVASQRRPRKVIDIESVVVDREEELVEKQEESAPIITYSDDKDANWTKKGGKAVYGYKIHAATDTENGFVLGGEATAANISDTTMLESVVLGIKLPKGAEVLADKGYASKANREILKNNGFADGIMYKAQRNSPLTEEEKQINKKISKKRWLVERCFGSLKTLHGLCRARYLGKKKVELEFYLSSLAYNLKKAVNLAF